MNTDTITITRRIEFDAGHRIPDHSSKCRNIHGHRYAIEVTITGPIKQEAGAEENGMVADFSSLRTLITREIADPWDHAMLVYKGDKVLCSLLEQIPHHKTVLLDSVPTVEELALLSVSILRRALRSAYGEKVQLVKVRLYETPNCWADVTSL